MGSLISPGFGESYSADVKISWHIRDQTAEKYGFCGFGHGERGTLDLVGEHLKVHRPRLENFDALSEALPLKAKRKTHDLEKIAHYAEMA